MGCLRFGPAFSGDKLYCPTGSAFPVGPGAIISLWVTLCLYLSCYMHFEYEKVLSPSQSNTQGTGKELGCEEFSVKTIYANVRGISQCFGSCHGWLVSKEHNRFCCNARNKTIVEKLRL